MKNLKAVIVGVGNIGTHHATSIADGKIKGLNLCGVCDTNPIRTENFCGKANVYTDFKEMFDKEKPDAAIIAVPHPLHALIAKEALCRGINVLVEKPVDISITKAKELNDVAEKSGKIFAVMFNQRTNGLFKKAREIVQSGKLGTLKRSVWIITNWYRTQSYYNSSAWRATWNGEGGGVLINQAPHNLDIWQWICGMPKSITAFCNEAKYHSVTVEDEATIYAEYHNGATGVFITSTGDLPGTNRFEITGTKGKIVLENGILKHWNLPKDERDICYESESGFINPKCEYTEYKCDDEGSHDEILQNFANAVLFGENLISPGYDGINELTISNAAYLSQWKSNQKILLPFDGKEFDDLLRKKADGSTIKLSEQGDGKAETNAENRWRVNWN